MSYIIQIIDWAAYLIVVILQVLIIIYVIQGGEICLTLMVLVFSLIVFIFPLSLKLAIILGMALLVILKYVYKNHLKQSEENQNTAINSSEDSQDEEKNLENYEKIKKMQSPVDFNTSILYDISLLPYITFDDAKQIVKLRRDREFKSYDEIQALLDLTDDQMSVVKQYSVIKRHVNINTADFEELITLPALDDARVRKILEARKKEDITSVIRLKEVTGLNSAQLQRLIRHIEFKPSQKTEETRTEKVEPVKEKPLKEPEDLVDINHAGINELSKLPSITLINAKKIIQMREAGVYINSYEDLQEKMNLKDYQINQIKEKSTIVPVETKRGRRLDL